MLLNSIGDEVCRPAFVAELVGYYREHLAELPDAERGRLERNPLRLLDSKDPAMAALNAMAPRIVDRLCAACADHFAALRAHLEALGIGYRLEPGLVRGLDYYTRTAFEYYRRGAEGQQQALGGGGRYDGLVELLGGRPTPGIGFGIGLDRTVLALAERSSAPDDRPPGPLAVVVGSDPAATARRLVLVTELRAAGLAARAELGQRKLSRQLEAAARDGAHFAVIVGDDEGDAQVQLRDLQAGTQRTVGRADLARELTRAAGSHQHG